jgi:hypothetical protein
MSSWLRRAAAIQRQVKKDSGYQNHDPNKYRIINTVDCLICRPMELFGRVGEIERVDIVVFQVVQSEYTVGRTSSAILFGQTG